MTFEHLVKAIELSAKYSWACAVAIGFVLFVPPDAAAQLGLLPIRQQYLGFLWIGLVGSVALFVSAAAPSIKGFFSNILKQRREEQEKLEKRAKWRESMANRMRSLGPQELLWFQYCLYHGQQTLFGEAYLPLGEALAAKQMVVRGSGDVWRISYTLKDEVWRLAQELVDELLPPERRNAPGLERELKNFEQSLFRRGY